jgi:hypothetical protein
LEDRHEEIWHQLKISEKRGWETPEEQAKRVSSLVMNRLERKLKELCKKYGIIQCWSTQRQNGTLTFNYQQKKYDSQDFFCIIAAHNKVSEGRMDRVKKVWDALRDGKDEYETLVQRIRTFDTYLLHLGVLKLSDLGISRRELQEGQIKHCLFCVRNSFGNMREYLRYMTPSSRSLFIKRFRKEGKESTREELKRLLA